MHGVLLALLPAYTAAVVLACRHYWAHRCAECAYRSRTAHPAGRHRARTALPVTPVRPLPAPPRAYRPPALPARRTTPALAALPARADSTGHTTARTTFPLFAQVTAVPANPRRHR